jgi:hypothetical protein
MRLAVLQRAGQRCEYCHLPIEFTADSPHIDHVIAKQHGGETVLHNLALACTSCNAHKGPNLSGIDPTTGNLTPLFNPRTHHWSDHFSRLGGIIQGRTPEGKATAVVLALNAPDNVAVRIALIEEGRMPDNEA